MTSHKSDFIKTVAERGFLHQCTDLEALDELAAMDVKLAVVTNKFEGFAAEILEQLDLTDRFVTLIGGDSLGKDADGNFRAKPAADPVLTAMERCGSSRPRAHPRKKSSCAEASPKSPLKV